MLSYRKGDLIERVTEGTIMHSCNSHGIMGAGFAKQLKEVYPKNYELYKEWCDSWCDDRTGNILGNAIITKENNEKLCIINAVTQQDFATPLNPRATSYDAVDNVFRKIYNTENPIFDHINMPRIGSGLGGGNWNIILEIILSHLPDDKRITVWDLQ